MAMPQAELQTNRLAKTLMSSSVKSAIRVLEVLEYLDSTRHDASVTEIARELGYPISSTSMLLQTMAERGYLEQDARRTYRMTPRVTLLGAWVAPRLAPDSAVLTMMAELSGSCGAAIVLAIAGKTQVRYIYVIPATKTVRMHVSPGTTRPMANSGFGRLFMSAMSDEDVRQVVFRHNAQLPMGSTQLTLSAVQQDIRMILSNGYAVSYNQATPGAGVVAVKLPEHSTDIPMAVGIGAPSELIRENAVAYAKLLKDCVQRYCSME